LTKRSKDARIVHESACVTTASAQPNADIHAEQFDLATRVSSRPDLLMSAFGLSLKNEHCVS
jgi:hypothetical protein